MASPIDISPWHMGMVCDILQKRLPPNVDASVFGSRADWTTTNSSDLDIALEGDGKLEYETVNALEYAFEKSDLPYRVDVVDLNRVDDTFRRIVEAQKVPLDIHCSSDGDDGWLRVAVPDAAAVVTGGTPNRGAEEYWDGEIPRITAKDVFSARSRYLDHSREFITERGLESCAAKPMPKGTIIMAAKGAAGALAQLAQDAAIDGTCHALVPRDGVHNDFLFYALRGALRRLRAPADGTAGAVGRTALDGWRIHLPPPSKQREIANVLGTLDDRIDLNRRMGQTLERMAQALFKSWFVDFEFPDGSGGPYRPSGGGMVRGDGPGREVPRDWTTKSMGEIADFLDGLPLQKHPPDGKGGCLPAVKAGELRRGVTDSSDRAAADISEQYIVEDGDVLLSWSGGPECVVWSGGRGALSRRVFKATPQNCPKWFCYFWIMRFLHECRHAAKGGAATTGRAQRRRLDDFPVLVPDAASLKTMDRVMSKFFEKMTAVGTESRRLIRIRDCLLPRLVSGKIRVPTGTGKP